MKLQKPPQTLPDGTVEAAHEVEAVCLHCGYNVAIQVTTLPPMFGGVM